MTETPEESTTKQHTNPKRTDRNTDIAGCTVAAVVLVLVVSINAGWLPVSAWDESARPLRENNPPEIVSFTPSTDRIAPLDTISIACEAVDPDGSELSYFWSASDGELVGEGSEVNWVAPPAEGLHRVFVTVDDGHGGTDEGSLALRVRENRPPEILVMASEIGQDVEWVIPGSPVRVWCEAEDADGDALTYEWSASQGEMFGDGRSIIWLAPDTLGMHWITVIVYDSHGGVTERSIPLTVSAAEPPSISGFQLKAIDTDMFKPHGDSWRIFKERTCSIEALVDEDERTYNYHWTADAGTITADGPNAVWQAPAGPKGWVTILLEVSDPHGNVSSESVRIYVETCPSCM